MKVTLPGEYSGEEILKAFELVVAIEEPRREKWFIQRFGGEVEYKPGSVYRVVHEGVVATRRVWAKTWLFFGEYCWRDPLGLTNKMIRLSPLSKEERYSSVNIDVGTFPADDHPTRARFCEEREDNYFRSILEVVIAKLFKELQKIPAPA